MNNIDLISVIVPLIISCINFNLSSKVYKLL